MSYILDISKLEIGDIILTSEDRFISSKIRRYTNGNYSHAMIYVGMTLIHALLDGVYSKNPQRLIFDNKESIKVLRSIQPLSEQQRFTIEEYARSKVGSLYSVTEAIKSIKNNKTEKPAESSKQFCTRLVANCYNSADIKIVNNPDYCTPEEIETSKHLKEITAIRETSDYDLQFANTEDPNTENQNRAFNFLRNVRKLASHHHFDIATMNDVGVFLLENRDLDNSICKYLTKSNYLTHYLVDKKINPQRYDYKQTCAFIRTNSLSNDEYIHSILINERKIIDHQGRNLIRSFHNKKSGLKYFKNWTNLYKNILRITLERLLIIKQLASHSNSLFLDEINNNITYLRKLI